MTYWMSILMGILQGIAEFLPISSSGHLALFQHFFAMENVEESQMFFTVLLHFATLIAVCVYYWQDIIDMIREFFLGIRDLASRGRRGREKLPPPGGWCCSSLWLPCPCLWCCRSRILWRGPCPT